MKPTLAFGLVTTNQSWLTDELGVAIHHVDELRWFSERVIARLGSATT